MLLAKDEAIAAGAAQMLRKEQLLKTADTKIAALTLELAHHRRIRFAHKSEALSAEQRDLFDETWEVDLAAMQAELDAQAAALAQGRPKARRPRAGRQPLPEHLPRIEHRHEPDSCQCGRCGGALNLIGEDVSEQLDVEPARFFVHRHIRPQYACRACETVTAAPVPPAIIDGGMAAPGLLAWLAVSKHVDHLPLYRIAQIGARQDVPLPISTTADWLGKVGVAVQPLADRLAELLKLRPTLHADETPVRQLDPGQGKTKRAYLWAYRSNGLDEGPPIVVFDYQGGRAGAHAQTFLGPGAYLMVDDYAGYKGAVQPGRHGTGVPGAPAPQVLRPARGLAAVAAGRCPRPAVCERQTRGGPPTLPGIAPGTGQALARPVPAMARRHPPGRGRRQQPPRPSTMPSSAGRRWCATPIQARCPSITIRWKTPSARSPSARRTGCSQAPSGPAAAPPPFKACSPPPSSMAWNPCAG